MQNLCGTLHLHEPIRFCVASLHMSFTVMWRLFHPLPRGGLARALESTNVVIHNNVIQYLFVDELTDHTEAN